LAETAISIGKLAAALTHEINTPLGALRSSIETLLAITDRQADAPPEKREIFAKMRVELCQSIRESATRIEDVMARLRRFITLEEAELKSADINDLLSDVALLYQEQINKGQIRLEFDMEQSLPALACRPQLLSAVFSSLLSNAIKAVNGSGGRIGIVTRRNDSGLRVTVSDNGRGMTAEEADSIFEPSFKVAAGRVSSGNWSLFNTRQIVYEHGGEIRIDTAPGKGTAFHVTLPLS
jgi:signal transduction histidine kinase